MSRIVELFAEVCEQKAELTAFYYCRGKKLLSKSFTEVAMDVDRATQYLHNMGVRADDYMLAFANPNYSLVIFILAAFKIGASVMYIDVFAKQDTFANLFKKYQPKFVLTSSRTSALRIFFPVAQKIQHVINIDQVKNVENCAHDFGRDLPETQIALLTTTTGSTSKPKIVVRTHGDLLAQLKLIERNIELPKKQPVVLTSSYMYVFANLLQGLTTVLPNVNLCKNPTTINRKLRKFEKVGINTILTSPDFCLKAKNIFADLEYLYFGGAIVNLTEAEKIEQEFGAAKIIYTYGCTECNLISRTPFGEYIKTLRETGESKLGEIVDGVKVQIGAQDEICVKSMARTDKYLNDVREHSEFYDTSDRGYLRDSELYYLGKAHAVLNTSSERLYSSQVEQDLVRHFDLSKCAILEQDKKFYLFLERKPYIAAIRVKKYLKKKYKIMPSVRYISKIPCDIKHHTKINYQKLRKKLK